AGGGRRPPGRAVLVPHLAQAYCRCRLASLVAMLFVNSEELALALVDFFFDLFLGAETAADNHLAFLLHLFVQCGLAHGLSSLLADKSSDQLGIRCDFAAFGELTHRSRRLLPAASALNHALGEKPPPPKNVLLAALVSQTKPVNTSLLASASAAALASACASLAACPDDPERLGMAGDARPGPLLPYKLTSLYRRRLRRRFHHFPRRSCRRRQSDCSVRLRWRLPAVSLSSGDEDCRLYMPPGSRLSCCAPICRSLPTAGIELLVKTAVRHLDPTVCQTALAVLEEALRIRKGFRFLRNQSCVRKSIDLVYQLLQPGSRFDTEAENYRCKAAAGRTLYQLHLAGNIHLHVSSAQTAAPDSNSSKQRFGSKNSQHQRLANATASLLKLLAAGEHSDGLSAGCLPDAVVVAAAAAAVTAGSTAANQQLALPSSVSTWTARTVRALQQQRVALTLAANSPSLSALDSAAVGSFDIVSDWRPARLRRSQVSCRSH
uniref:Rab-GAP TBC domain-containing protein n=1 Tax=Macrostomum lignano TaxID=282301 RepID=A0A1I8FEA8_9PLAT